MEQKVWLSGVTMGTEGYKSSVKPMYVEVGVIQREKNVWLSYNYSSVSDALELKQGL